jgi:hypothetical protein
MNIIELLVNVKQGAREVDYFEDFFVNVAKGDTFAVFNHTSEYAVAGVDRTKKRVILEQPYQEGSEQNVRAHVQKSVGKPADLYALGGLFYYLISGATRNPKALNDTFQKFIEYDGAPETNSVGSYLKGEYEALEAARSRSQSPGLVDRMFPYQHFNDGNGETIPLEIMSVIMRCMIRGKIDSYYNLQTDDDGITQMVRDLVNLYAILGLRPTAAMQHTVVHANTAPRRNILALYSARTTSALGKLYESIRRLFTTKR